MAKAALKSAPAPAPAAQGSRQTEDAAPPNEASPKKKRGRLVLWLALLLILGGASGGAAWMFLRESPEAAAAPAPKNEKPPVFISLDTFTVNLQQEVGDQFLQTALTVKATEDGVPEALKLHMPQIRNSLLLLLSSKRPSELLNVEGKLTLADEILEQVRKPLPETLRAHVVAVYYTSFVIQ